MEKVKYIYVENERQKLNDMLRTRKVALKIGGEDIVGIESFGVIMNTNYLESLANSEDPYGFIFIDFEELLVKKTTKLTRICTIRLDSSMGLTWYLSITLNVIRIM